MSVQSRRVVKGSQVSASDDVDGSPTVPQNDLRRAGSRITVGIVTTVGFDIAKNVFQLHGVDVEGAAVIRQRLSRWRMLKFFAKLPPCLVGIEVCTTSR